MLPCDEATLRTCSSEEVRSWICGTDRSWRDLVAAEVAAHIDLHGSLEASCPADAGRPTAIGRATG